MADRYFISNLYHVNIRAQKYISILFWYIVNNIYPGKYILPTNIFLFNQVQLKMALLILIWNNFVILESFKPWQIFLSYDSIWIFHGKYNVAQIWPKANTCSFLTSYAQHIDKDINKATVVENMAFYILFLNLDNAVFRKVY